MHSFKLVPTVLSATALATVTGTAASAGPTGATQQLEQIENYSNQGQQTQSQVNSVSQLRDVAPDDWAFEALRNLVETYGCLEGYPNQSFRGNRALTRYEFAAGLNSCLQALEQQQLSQQDLQRLQRLVEEFEAELATLGTRVDNLEGRVATLEENQFSTTTKFSGEVVFAVTDSFSDDLGINIDSFVREDLGVSVPSGINLNNLFRNAVTSAGGTVNDDLDDNTVFQNRVRLLFESSFTGTDQLFTRIDLASAPGLGTTSITAPSGAGLPGALGGASLEGEQGRLTFQNDTGNNAILGWLAYYFSPTENSRVYLPPAGALHQDYAPTLSPYFEGFTGASNALSNVAESSPIYKINMFGGGVGVNYELTDNIKLTGGYLGTGDQFSPGDRDGLFNGSYSALGQIAYLGDRFKVGFTYVNAYLDGGRDLFTVGTGTLAANDITNLLGGRAITNSFGVEGSVKLSDGITLNAYGGYTKADSRAGANAEADIWYYSLGAAFPDLGGEGNLGGVLVGSEPYVGGLEVSGNEFAFDDTALRVEGFYRYQLTERLSITPGVVWLGAPGFPANNDDNAVIGTLRTTFQF